MKIYHYHPETGEFVNPDEARPNPLEPGEFLIPAYATSITPPEVSGNEIAVFSNEAWRVLPDFRNKTFYKKDSKEEVRITEIGIIPDEIVTEIKPNDHDEWNYDTGQWSYNLDTLKQEIVFQIKEAASRIILSRYSYHKQININELQGYTEQDKIDMWHFINDVRGQANTMADNVLKLNDIDTVSNYKIDFNIL